MTEASIRRLRPELPFPIFPKRPYFIHAWSPAHSRDGHAPSQTVLSALSLLFPRVSLPTLIFLRHNHVDVVCWTLTEFLTAPSSRKPRWFPLEKPSRMRDRPMDVWEEIHESKKGR